MYDVLYSTFFGIGRLLVLIILLVIIFSFVPFGLRITARSSGVKIRMIDLIAMKFRKVQPKLIVNAMIKSTKAGLSINMNDLESHFLSGGDVNQVVDAMIAAERANIDLGFQKAAAINLAGRNVLESVRISVTPKVINTPEVAAVAIDGIEVRAIAKVTVKADIDKLVGGAGEETVIARVGEGIVTTIGSSQTYNEVLENPDKISKTVLNKGLDSGTAFEILSIDIADVNVGQNIGAKLQAERAEADKNIAQAKAEERRVQAIAVEQENKAKVVEAQAEVPKAIAQAFREGKLGVMDYYNMQNIQSDTEMRNSISEMSKDDGNKK
ncbi:MAG: flotillin-like protein FloA [Peptoniphilaceae bacterium]|nr:flotillin-like protein FloA [Peptoniphilaceae bacterium]MDD7383513.1 flotillin-like protein FloA [Peptoniphilaceae bacterium]MDY3738686.1 flotillin-like protein FloA [Peptoniphilaceae bacterium]